MKHQKTPFRNSRSKGFTLLEIMIAVLIISIGLAALANPWDMTTAIITIAAIRIPVAIPSGRDRRSTSL